MELWRILSRYEYADARIEKSSESLVRITDDEVRQTAGFSEGTGVRVLENGSWGFASGNEDIEKLLKKAQKLAVLGKGKIKLTIPKSGKKELKDKADIIPAEEQVKRLLEASKDMKGKQVASRSIICSDGVTTKKFCNSEGAEIIQQNSYTYLSCSCIARDGENIQRGSGRSASRTGFEGMDLSVSGQAKEKALRLLDASPAPKGRFVVVLDPEMTGVFSHEAVGHACEADAVIDGESLLAGKIGKKIGNELVSISDDPLAQDFGRYEYDDEGTKAAKAVLVEKGVLKGFINSMESACALRLKPNGHARAQGCETVPVVRMSNTYFQSGTASLDDVFDIRTGIYLKGMRGGSVDIFSGGFMFKAEESYEIRNGELGRVMRDAAISGNILETMLNVECVGKDFGTSPGMCGKFGQEVPVSDGGPHIRVKNVAIG